MVGGVIVGNNPTITPPFPVLTGVNRLSAIALQAIQLILDQSFRAW